MNRTLRGLALVAALMVAVAVVYSGRLSAFLQLDHAGRGVAKANAEAPGDRKVLYWYDAMNPQHTYKQPGKAPDGMDLLPKYAEAASAPTAAQPANSSAKAGERKILYWYDPMHPAYKSDKPGTAPDCGMDLVPKYAEEEGAPSLPSGTVTVPSGKQQLMGVRTATVERKALVRNIRTTAQIAVDETRIGHIHVKVPGYIDKVYVDFIGQLVKKGQPVFTLYSPDLVAAQQEYLIAKRGEKTLAGASYQEVSQGAESLLRSARERLRLWDISEAQLKKLDETGVVNKTITFYSPVAGFVTDRKAFPQASVTPDTELYTVSDLSTVWAIADIYEYEVPYVRVGQRLALTLSYYPGKTYSGRIAYIYPTVDPQTRTVKARIELPNPNFQLKPGMLADAQLEVNLGSNIVVPQEAVLNSGQQQTVFVAHEGGTFEPRKVTLGPAVDGQVIILSGLKVGETIVTSGNFLIDSESKLQSATSGLQH